MEIISLKQRPTIKKMTDFIDLDHLLNFYFHVMFPFEKLGKIVALSILCIVY